MYSRGFYSSIGKEERRSSCGDVCCDARSTHEVTHVVPPEGIHEVTPEVRHEVRHEIAYELTYMR